MQDVDSQAINRARFSLHWFGHDKRRRGQFRKYMWTVPPGRTRLRRSDSIRRGASGRLLIPDQSIRATRPKSRHQRRRRRTRLFTRTVSIRAANKRRRPASKKQTRSKSTRERRDAGAGADRVSQRLDRITRVRVLPLCVKSGRFLCSAGTTRDECDPPGREIKKNARLYWRVIATATLNIQVR